METMMFGSGIEINNRYNIINTIRKGSKWAEKLSPGDSVYLKLTDGEHSGIEICKNCDFPMNHPCKFDGVRLGTVRRSDLMKFFDLEKEDLQYNFDPNCRELLGIFNRMKELYGDFEAEDDISVVDIQIL